MTELQEILLGRTAASQLLFWLANAALKGFLVLAATAAVCILLRRASASQKHLCWSVALAAVLILPLLSLLLPSISIALLPRSVSLADIPHTSGIVEAPAVTAVAPADAAPSATAGATADAEVPSATGAAPASSAAAPAADALPPATGAAPASAAAAPRAVARAHSAPDRAGSPGIGGRPEAGGAPYANSAAGAVELIAPVGAVSATSDGADRIDGAQAAITAEALVVPPQTPGAWPIALIALWAAGAAAVLFYLLFGVFAVRRIVRRAEDVADAEWKGLLEQVRERLRISRPVRLLRSREVTVPMTWGWIRPVVLLPFETLGWTAEKKRCVLAHELAHVTRADCLTQSVATAACALHWFNPLVWRAARDMRLEREKACDDAVLQAVCTTASAYASHLLDIARSAPSNRMGDAAALTMARRSQLEGRVVSILDEGPRRRVRRPTVVASALSAALVVLPLAAMRPVPITVTPDAPVMAATSKRGAVTQIGTTSAVSQQPSAKAPAQKSAMAARDVIKRSFDVSPGGRLGIETEAGSIEVRTADQNRVDVEVHRRVRGSASEEDFRVSFEHDGDEVEIVGERVRRAGWGRDGISVEFVVTVPRRFDVDLETAGGNISMEDLDGAVEVTTAGGNISFGDISGSVHAHTSGGNVSVDGSNGDVIISTSGGNIRLGRVSGTVDVETSGGNIEVEEVHETVRAATSGGSIVARIVDQPRGDSILETSGGGVTIYVADDIGLDIDAETSAGRVISDIEISMEGKIRPDHLRGSINGGGPELRLDTSAGNIHIRRL